MENQPNVVGRLHYRHTAYGRYYIYHSHVVEIQRRRQAYPFRALANLTNAF